jgi:hypothetical protein
MRIPSYQEIEKIILESGKITKEALLSELQKVRADYQGFIQGKDVLAYLLAKKLEVEVPISSRVESVSISRLPKTASGDYFNLTGYLVDVREAFTKKRKRVIKFLLVDETGYIEGSVYGSVIDEFESKGIKKGDLVDVMNARVDVGGDNVARLSLFGDAAGIVMSTNKLKPLTEFALQEELDALTDAYYIVTGLCYAVKIRPYTGCSECSKSSKGEQIGALSQCCGAPLKEHKWVSLSLVSSDGLSGVDVTLSPRLVGELTDEKTFMDKIVRVEGVYNTRDKAIRAISVSLVPMEKSFKGFFGEKLV